MRSKSSQPRRIPHTISFSPVVLAAMKDLSRESDRSISSLMNSLAANHLLLLGRIAFELEDDQETPEANIRFIEDKQYSQGRSEFVLDAEDLPGAEQLSSTSVAAAPGGNGSGRSNVKKREAS